MNTPNYFIKLLNIYRHTHIYIQVKCYFACMFLVSFGIHLNVFYLFNPINKEESIYLEKQY